MLSHLTRRCIHPNRIRGKIVENSYIILSSVQYSSDGDNKKDPNTFAGISEPMVPGRKRPRSQITDEVFDALVRATSTPKKVLFKRAKDKDSSMNNASKMKPGQLNIKMVTAAKDVAAKAGPAKDEVMDDLISKLDEVFVGVGPHIKKGKRKFIKADKKIEKSVAADPRIMEVDVENLNDIMGNLDFKKSSTSLPKTHSKRKGREIVPDNVTNLITAEVEDFNDVMKELDSKSSSNMKSNKRMENITFDNVEMLQKKVTAMNIFPSNWKEQSQPSLKLWSALDESEIQRLTKFEPLNWFDQCIQWTEEGKLWRFPIDNEQGMDEEAKVDFTEHIFLDHHIESWCPQEGPIKHFMDLVLVGLSKNPYITVSEKIETLEWFKNYFLQHQALLQEIEAFGSVSNPIPVQGQLK